MPKATNLIYLLRTNRTALGALLDDVSEEESLDRGKDNLQHIRWNTGHILVSMNLLLKALGAPPEESEEYHRLFGRGESFVKDPAAYPPMARLRDEVFAVHDAAIAAAEKKTDEELDRDLPQETGFAATIMNAGLFLCSHTFYHAGQIAQLRRVLGRERSFG